MTRRELLGRMDSAEINDWVAFDRIHVSDTDALLANLCALVYNANRAKGVRPLAPWDFLPKLRPPHDPESVARKLRAWVAMKTA